jgi:hypothetical protein
MPLVLSCVCDAAPVQDLNFWQWNCHGTHYFGNGTAMGLTNLANELPQKSKRLDSSLVNEG